MYNWRVIFGCSSSNSSIQCINSCNGICYSNSQYCYNNTKICSVGESVCNVQNSNNYFSSYPLGLNCYNPSSSKCYNNTLCNTQYACGTQCLTNYNSACANNQTICNGFYYYSYYPYGNAAVMVCGPNQTCYDNSTSVCLNQTTVCPGINSRLCGSNCYNPDTQICGNGTIRCINSCNGTCYSNSQYCYNNTKVCSTGESVCNVKYSGGFSSYSLGLTCYNSSLSKCYNNTLCNTQYACGTQCLTDYYSSCANNRTICSGFYYYSYYYNNPAVMVCGPNQTCYDNSTSVCLNQTTVCSGLNSRLCGSNCYNPDTQICGNGTIRCINSCNGTCYSNSQYCYNNTKICSVGESVCNVQNSNNYFSSYPLGLNCYNPSSSKCYNNTLCNTQYACGAQCLTNYNSACANNQTICNGFYYYSYYPYGNAAVMVCGPNQTCYDNSISVCIGNGTLCSIGSQLCNGLCYNPQSQYCIGGNNTIYCTSNPSSPNCPIISTASTPSTYTVFNNDTGITTTIATPIVPSGSCCAVQNCTQNSDCCGSSSMECQCFRHNTADVYGSCINPFLTPMCGTSCPVQGRCKTDSDCCKCQCVDISFTDVNEQLITKKQCVRR
ncbi:unnamed protein product [Adineta steineri]|uniref:Uncharacterized protein n=1 Tax=Adineta steineri TaxID=433720 RepID=A0A815B1Q8_9BILA|nr:unnamed protein product [Adineta steineri]